VTAGEPAQPVEMRVDVAKQRVWKVDTKQIRQRRIGAIEIHSGCIRRKQSRLTGRRRYPILLEWLHRIPLFVSRSR
jgi:hypothetical protein